MNCSMTQQQSIFIRGKRVADGVRDEEPDEEACRDEGVFKGEDDCDLSETSSTRGDFGSEDKNLFVHFIVLDCTN